MSTTTDTAGPRYRWNQATAARDYDSAATVIHPYYHEVQQQILKAIPFSRDAAIHVVDLGAGSGRLAEKILKTYPNATITLVEPSAPFRALAEQRFVKAGISKDRFKLTTYMAQDNHWVDETPQADLIVSTSALHHLDAQEKNRAFGYCFEALKPGGLFINGDEYRPPSDRTYRQLLTDWHEHMQSALAAGEIPHSFSEIIEKWYLRNLIGFDTPRYSGDDCHETIEEQSARLYGASFAEVTKRWQEALWAVLVAVKN